jgi:hypothetical protein
MIPRLAAKTTITQNAKNDFAGCVGAMRTTEVSHDSLEREPTPALRFIVAAPGGHAGL